ncbi:MAG: sortase [Clostridia bacterium]|nr:sortase [Clostridia bacterium]
MFDKYGNILTMLLVIFIVAIFGIVGYFAYDLLNSNNINENAQSAMDQFEASTQTVKKDKNTNKVNKIKNENVADEYVPIDRNLVNPLEELNALNANRVEEEPVQEEPEKVYMEDYEVKGTIEIPKTGIKYPVLDSVTKRSLEIAVGIAYGPGLNQVGNTIIYGHNYRNGLFFSDNKKLTSGDVIYITDQYGEKVTYEIYNIYQTTANDASYFTRDTEGRREISLQTCTDDSSGRIIIWAAEKAQ